MSEWGRARPGNIWTSPLKCHFSIRWGGGCVGWKPSVQVPKSGNFKTLRTSDWLEGWSMETSHLHKLKYGAMHLLFIIVASIAQSSYACCFPAILSSLAIYSSLSAVSSTMSVHQPLLLSWLCTNLVVHAHCQHQHYIILCRLHCETSRVWISAI